MEKMEIETTREKEIADEDEDLYTLDKLLIVAMVGAIASLALYYIYNQLSEETRQSIKDTIIRAFKNTLQQPQETE